MFYTENSVKRIKSKRVVKSLKQRKQCVIFAEKFVYNVKF